MRRFSRSLGFRLFLVCGAEAGALAACDGGPADPKPEVEVAVEGWLERGGEVELTLTVDGVPADADAVEWSFEPEAAATRIAGNRARLLSVGMVKVRGRVDDQADSVTIEVAAPPRIVFDRMVEGNRDLWSISLDGQDLTRLTTSPAADLEASAAGGEIVFASYRDGNAELYAMPATGGEPRRLTTNDRTDLSPAISGAGGRVAYTDDLDGTPKLWLLELGGGDPAAAHGEAEPGIIHNSPAWRPGAEALAYVTTTRGTADIHLFSPGSGDEAPLVEGPFADVEPAWDAAGERLAFVSNRDGDTELYLLDVASGEVTRLTDRPGSDSQPAWLADGRIVYRSAEGAGSTLRWLDPADASRTFEIPVEGGGALRPAALD